MTQMTTDEYGPGNKSGNSGERSEPTVEQLALMAAIIDAGVTMGDASDPDITECGQSPENSASRAYMLWHACRERVQL